MYKIKECIIVEGTYDKIKLSRFIDGVILVVNGFGVYNNKEMLQTIKKLAEEMGIVILTDSDSAGFRIRSYIKQNIKSEYVKHAYIPDIKGKEKRKSAPGKEGLLGVEGIDDEIIVNALIDAGCEINGDKTQAPKGRSITKADLMRLGLSGGKDSHEKRIALQKEMGLPAKLSSNMLLDVLNRMSDIDELEEILSNI